MKERHADRASSRQQQITNKCSQINKTAFGHLEPANISIYYSMRLHSSTALQLATLLAMAADVHGQVYCWTNMDSQTGLCTGAVIRGRPFPSPEDCKGLTGLTAISAGLSGLPVDLPFYSDSDVFGAACSMVPGASPLGDCCKFSDCQPADCIRRYNPEQCPEGYPYFEDHYIQFAGVQPACTLITSSKCPFVGRSDRSLDKHDNSQSVYFLFH